MQRWKSDESHRVVINTCQVSYWSCQSVRVPFLLNVAATGCLLGCRGMSAVTLSPYIISLSLLSRKTNWDYSKNRVWIGKRPFHVRHRHLPVITKNRDYSKGIGFVRYGIQGVSRSLSVRIIARSKFARSLNFCDIA